MKKRWSDYIYWQKLKKALNRQMKAMAKIKWAPHSLEDIEAVANFIKRDSSYYARMFTIKVFEVVDR